MSATTPRSRRRALRTTILVTLLTTVMVAWLSAPAPRDPGLVADGAGLLTSDQRAAIARYHEHLLAAHDIDYRVITDRHLTDINEAAVERFRELGRSSRSRSGRGLLLLIDAVANRVRLEVGYPLEGTFTDVFVDYVERQQMVPFFERGRVADGIVATTELIVSRAQGAGDDLGSATVAWVAATGGAGAVMDARLGAGPRPAREQAPHAVQPGNSPQATLNAYFEAMAAHDANPELPIYTPDTRAMLRDWLMTPAQMDNVVDTYRRCAPEAPIVSGVLGVIRYPPAARTCAPFFFRRENGVWLLDLTMMRHAIRFGPANAWHFAPGVEHPYGFGFVDWQFDVGGYPRVGAIRSS